MGTMVLDINKLNSNVLPYIIKTKNSLQDSYSTSGTLRDSLPGSFSNRNLVNEITNQIHNVKKDVGNVEQIITKKIRKNKTNREQKKSSCKLNI